MDEKKKDLIGEEIKCDIDAIIENKIKKLSGYGVQKAISALEEIYLLTKLKAPDIEIFDKMAKLSWMLREYTSKTKGKQQQLLGL